MAGSAPAVTGLYATMSDTTVLLGLTAIVVLVLVPFVVMASRWQLRRQQEFVRRQQAEILAQRIEQFAQAQAMREAMLAALERQTALLEEIRDAVTRR